MKYGIFAFVAIQSSAPAFGQQVTCTDNNNSDYEINLDVENGQVKSAHLLNQDWGAGGHSELSPSDVDYNGSTLTYNGDLYSCN